MTPRQRAATAALCDAVLACSCCTPALRRRAESLRARVTGDYARLSYGALLIVGV